MLSPRYRFKKNLSPATIGDKNKSPKDVINCWKLSKSEQFKLCMKRINFLRETLSTYKTQGNGLIEVVEFIEELQAQEFIWASELEVLINRQLEPPKSYTGLVPAKLEEITHLGKTTRNKVFYIRYITKTQRRGCSFVATRKLAQALNDIQQIANSNADELLNSGVRSSLPLLTKWNNGEPLIENYPKVTNIQQQRIKKELCEVLVERQFSNVLPVEEDGDTYFRVYHSGKFVGVIVVTPDAEISVQEATGSSPVSVSSTKEAIAILEAILSPASYDTITPEDWKELKAIAKITGHSVLTVDDVLKIVLNPKYLRPLQPDEIPSPRMILRQHFQEIKKQLNASVNQKLAEEEAYRSRQFFSSEQDYGEYLRMRLLYPRDASKLKQLGELAVGRRLKLTQLVAQPFSVYVASEYGDLLAKFTNRSVSEFVWQMELFGEAAKRVAVEDVETAINLLAKKVTPIDQLALFPVKKFDASISWK